MCGASTIVLGWTKIRRLHKPIRARRACENAGLRARRFDGFAGDLYIATVSYVRLSLTSIGLSLYLLQ